LPTVGVQESGSSSCRPRKGSVSSSCAVIGAKTIIISHCKIYSTKFTIASYNRNYNLLSSKNSKGTNGTSSEKL
jgi:hypothetical protein